MNRLLRQAVLLLCVSDGFGSAFASTGTHEDIAALIPSTPAPSIPIATSSNGATTVSATATTSVPATLDSRGSATTRSTGTCSSRTINYITHTLAQQCLRTDRVPQSGAHISNAVSSELSTHLVKPLETPIRTTRTETITVNTTVGVASSNTIERSSDAATSTGPDVGPSLPTDEDGESPLDNANFLSFEEWKKQNLAKMGQSPEDLQRAQQINANRQRPGINNALDTLGEEHEIDLDFSGFGAGAQLPPVAEKRGDPSATDSVPASAAGQQLAASPTLRSKDAGKTCKERTNYASFDCAATILKSNKECKSASSVLVENKDSYMLNICSADNKFFIVELCDDIQIDTVVLANYEFFSSSFRHFKVSVSDRYPVKLEKWRDLGTFEARNTREIQAFLVQNPLIWARYLRIEFLTHYGTEYYCPVSVLRVHGTTMWEDYRHQEELARGEEDEVVLEAEVEAVPPVAQEPLASTVEDPKSTVQSIPEVKSAESASIVQEASASTSSSEATPHDGISKGSPDPSAPTATSASAVRQSDVKDAPESISGSKGSTTNPTDSASTTDLDEDAWSPGNATEKCCCCCEWPNIFELDYSDISDAPSNMSGQQQPYANISGRSDYTRTVSSQNGSQPVAAPSTTPPSVTKGPPTTQNNTSSMNTTRPAAAATSTTAPAPPQPSSQESFFKSFHKRLQQLESNSTLSLQYIEEQSRILRDAFTKVEKRQLSTTTKFLSTLNSTVMAELQNYRLAYDQLWQSTVIELEGQRESYQDDMLALSRRLTMVADELVWQKRMGIVQSTLLLLCLALVLFGRNGSGQLEVPLMQHMMNRSATAFRSGGWDSPPNSPSPDSRSSPVSLFRKRIWRSSPDLNNSDAGNQQRHGSPDQYSQPGIVVEAPSPDVRTEREGYFDEQNGLGLLDRMSSAPGSRMQAATPPASTNSSPKKHRKKQKKGNSQSMDASGRRTGGSLLAL
ncbi:unnamed protein product [Zymoseptoria tritici ST99CH_3D1]|nr:unnamed protein product [Zymoseptoria tritici ST99CH_3D1]